MKKKCDTGSKEVEANEMTPSNPQWIPPNASSSLLDMHALRCVNIFRNFVKLQ